MKASFTKPNRFEN
uniref:Uncharacterized protein n=1 Tax=Arundo donax TaxID=35708 RepID=A0A0A9HN03_ARUDO